MRIAAAPSVSCSPTCRDVSALGDTLDEAVSNAHAALQLYAEAEHAAGRKLPQPRTFAELYEIRAEAKGAPFIGIRLDVESKARKPGKSRPPAIGKPKKRAAS